MDCKEEKSNSNTNSASERKKKRRGFWVFLSCFGGGSDMSDDDAIKGCRVKSLVVVPVDTSGGESDRSTNKEAIVGKKQRKKEINCRKSFKDKSKVTNAPAKPQPTQQVTIVYHVASNLKPETETSLLYRMLDPVQTQTRTSHSGSSEPGSPPTSRKVSEESSKENGYGPSMGLCMLTIALALMVLGGLTLYVICMCTWFSVLYMLRPRKVPEQDGTSCCESDNTSEEVNVNSKEYKRMVVLRGFLERDKRKSLTETKKGNGVQLLFSNSV